MSHFSTLSSIQLSCSVHCWLIILFYLFIFVHKANTVHSLDKCCTWVVISRYHLYSIEKLIASLWIQIWKLYVKAVVESKISCWLLTISSIMHGGFTVHCNYFFLSSSGGSLLSISIITHGGFTVINFYLVSVESFLLPEY